MQQPLHDIRINVPHTPKPRHAFALVIVGIIHAGLIYALAVGLATRVIQKSVEEIKVAVERPRLEKAAPPPPPDLAKPPPPVVPPPEIVVQQPAPVAAPNIQTHPVVAAPPPTPAPAAVVAASSPVSVGKAHTCGSRYYPESAQRLHEEGTTTVTFTVTEDGAVANPTVANSSGHDDLDSAALPCVMTWRYKPAIEAGKPVAAQWTANVVWKAG
jgi:protein TonB